jgi:hypothetical protein
VPVSTLVIHGDGDGTVPFEGSGKWTHQASPGSASKVLAGAQHGCNISQRTSSTRRCWRSWPADRRSQPPLGGVQALPGVLLGSLIPTRGAPVPDPSTSPTAAVAPPTDPIARSTTPRRPARAGRTVRPAARVLLLGLVLFGAYPGAWAVVAPRSFYDDFPGVLRSGWVAVDGPFNEHLVRDVGAMFLALALLAAAAAVTGDRRTAGLAGAAWLLFSALHAGYHLVHLHLSEPIDRWLNASSLVVEVLVAFAVLALCAPRRPGTPSDRDELWSGS